MDCIEDFAKGKLVSKGLFGILKFFPNTNKRIGHIVLLGKKTEFLRSFFGRIVGLNEPLRFCLTLSVVSTNVKKDRFSNFSCRCLNLNYFFRFESKIVLTY